MEVVDLTSPSPKKGKHEVLDLTEIVISSDSEEIPSIECFISSDDEEEKELVEMIKSTSISEDDGNGASDFAIKQILNQYGVKAAKSRKAMEDQIRELWLGSEKRSQKTTKPGDIDWGIVTSAIKRNTSLYQKMLLFQPVELESVLQYLAVETQFKITKQKLIKYFDEQGIFFKSRTKRNKK